MKKAFTLLEVNLAMFVMAMGVLSMIALYPLGFREADQSREDLAAAAYCESVLNSLAAALSSTNIPWSSWAKLANDENKKGATIPKDGWLEYFDDNYYGSPKRATEMKSIADRTFKQVLDRVGFKNIVDAKGNKYQVEPPPQPRGLACGLVVAFTGTRCAIAVRATRRPAMLLAQPLFFTEVNFQGEMEEGKK